MRTALAAALLALVPTADASARSWKLFQPLAVGNLWKYDVAPLASGTLPERLELQVIGQVDTLGTTYYRVARSTYHSTSGALLHTATAVYHYDDARRAIATPHGDLLFPYASGIGFASTAPGSDATHWCAPQAVDADEVACFKSGVGLLRTSRADATMRLTLARIDGKVVYTTSADPDLLDLPSPDPTAFRLWPNPAQGRVVAELPGTGARTLYDVDVYDMNGRRVRSYGIQTGFRTLDLSGLTTGLYLVVFDGRAQTLLVR